MEAAADHGLVAHHCHLAQGPPAIVNGLLPAEPTTLLNHPEVPVALRGHRLGRVARDYR
jgi:hypothetical protein